MARILIGNIKGPQGDTGPQGPQGEIGPVGPQGPLPPLINNALATEAGVAALDAVMGKTLQDQITQTNSNFTDLRNAFRTASPLPDDTAIDTLINPGTYNLYTTIDGKKNRWIVVVDWCNASGVSLSRQTAYYYLGAGPIAQIVRYQYNTGSGYAWSQWYSTDLRKKIILADTGVFHITRQNVIEHSDYYAIAITILPTGTPTTDTPMLTFPSQLAACVLPITTGFANGLTYASNYNQMFYRLLSGTINNTTEIIINGIIPKA